MLDNQAEFEALRDKIFQDTGLDCSRYKESYLKRRISARMRALGLETWSSYAAHLDSHQDEYPRLKDRITVNVTEFFRDRDVYDYLRDVLLPSLLERSASEGRPLFLWSAGCSSGEEPYSLALLLMKLKAPAFQILATDIDDACLDRARSGLYDPEAIEKGGEAGVGAWFEREGEWLRASDALKARIRFEKHNLFADPPMAGMDLVLCRNVMIYFSRDLQQRLLESFHASLRPGGWMLPGKTETILGPARQLYSSVSARVRAFQRA